MLAAGPVGADDEAAPGSLYSVVTCVGESGLSRASSSSNAATTRRSISSSPGSDGGERDEEDVCSAIRAAAIGGLGGASATAVECRPSLVPAILSPWLPSAVASEEVRGSETIPRVEVDDVRCVRIWEVIWIRQISHC